MTPTLVQGLITNFLFQKNYISLKEVHLISPQTDFRNDLAMESLDVVELILQLEENFRVEFEEAREIPQLHTVGSLSQFTATLANYRAEA